MLPCKMDYDTLAYYAHLIKLPMFVSMNMVVNENEIQYNHINWLCPYVSYGCSKLWILIIEGAHPQLHATLPTFIHKFYHEKIS